MMRRSCCGRLLVLAIAVTSGVPAWVGRTEGAVHGGSCSVDSLKIEVLPVGIQLWGQASLSDFRPGTSYVWSVRVRDPAKGRIVAEHRHDAQIFRVPPDTHEMKAAFAATLHPKLRPGAYKIELVLYEVPPGGVGLLDDPRVKEHQMMAKRSVKMVLVPPRK